MKNIIKNTNKKGFTIVELVIVIAVIAILAGVLIPTFANVIENANESAAKQEAQTVYKEIYAVDLSDGTLDGNAGKGENNADIPAEDKVTCKGTVTAYEVANGKVSSFIYTTDKYTVTYDGTASTWTASKTATPAEPTV